MKRIFARCAGINNKLDPKRLRLNVEGVTDLVEGVDVDIDDSGQVSRRNGRESLSSVASHSMFQDGGDCFVVQDRTSDSAIYKVQVDFTLAGVRSGLTKGRKVSFCQVGEKTYYSNGVENGVITAGASAPWPDTSEHYGAETTRVFYPAPAGSHIAYFLGCWWIAKGNTIFVSEFRSEGKFDLFGKRFSFGSDVRMIRPVLGGVWVSDSMQTGFIARADDFKAMTWAKKAEVPAHEWSDACTLHDYGKIEIPGLSATWSSDEGQCIGTQDGQLIVRTDDRLNYPSGSSGATVVTDDYILNSVW
jgi:hypothetical protein